MGNKKEQEIILDELGSLAPNLARLKEMDRPVDIPAGYFDQMTDELMQRIRDDQAAPETASSGWREWLWRQLANVRLRPSYALALSAMTVLVIGLALFLNADPPNENTGLTLSDEEINEYIHYKIDDFDLVLLVGEEGQQTSQPAFNGEKDSLLENELDIYLDEWLDELEFDELL